MIPHGDREIIRLRLEQAYECLDDACALLSLNRGFRTAINRSFYAAFYSALALMQTTGSIPRKHRGVLTLFDTEFVHTGKVPAEYSKILRTLFLKRVEDDYQYIDEISIGEAEDALGDARVFVEFIKNYINQNYPIA